MTNDYTNRLLNEFDRMFADLIGGGHAEIMPFPAEEANRGTDRVSSVFADGGKFDDILNDMPNAGFEDTLYDTPKSQFAAANTAIQIKRITDAAEQKRPSLVITEPNEAEEQLQKIAEVTNRISAQRFNPNAHIDILLADLIDSILQILFGNTAGDDFFKLLNEERKVELGEALTDFDFYNDNPYKTKAEKYLAKIEAKKNRR